MDWHWHWHWSLRAGDYTLDWLDSSDQMHLVDGPGISVSDAPVVGGMVIAEVLRIEVDYDWILRPKCQCTAMPLTVDRTD